MPTPFDFEYTFRAPSPETVLRAYFDPDHLAAQDKVGNLIDRRVTESHEDDATLRTSWHVRAGKTLPGFVKPFVDGGRLSFVESMTWRKRDGEIDMTITPQVLGGRVGIAATYTLRAAGDGKVHRRYKGAITASIPLLSGKIERAILEEITRGMPAMADCSQQWLARSNP
jgi:uncharacterized protein YndB with AHSA1/START domain